MLLSIALLCLGTVVQAAREPVGQNIIILLVDGLGSNLLNNTKSESQYGIRKMIENGVQAEYLRPSFPTHTWPTWFSLTTGMNTESHGFTADYMWDQEHGVGFERGKGPNDNDDVWWSDRPAPFWYTAGKAGVDIHCYWFAHCHRAHVDMIVQVPAKRWTDLSNPTQTDRLGDVFPEIVKRITKYQAYKQQMFLLRYAGIENALRQHGEGDEVDRAVAQADSFILDLQSKLEENELFSSTNLMVLSPYGLMKINSEEEQFYLEECLSDYSKVLKVVNLHSVVMVFTRPEDEGNVQFELKVCDQWAPMGDYDESDTPLVKVYKMSELPEEYHWKESRFLSGIVLVTKPGASIITRELPSLPAASDPAREWKQASGWDPETPEMKGTFIARGPAFRSNEKHGPIDLVDVYQMVMNILSVKSKHGHNGTWAHVSELMAEGWESRPTGDDPNSTFSTGILTAVAVALLGRLL